jgi:A/G-specific adenine glycosylase
MNHTMGAQYPSGTEKSFFRKAIVTWYYKYGRDFPWRNTDHPFHVLVAEIMLQQTFARKVIHPYEQFITSYPTPEKAARGRTSKMEEVFRPLGLLYRAGTLREASKVIVKEFGGGVPSGRIELLSLPGVGPYIAAAVQSIAFDLHAPVVDANVSRIMARFFGSSENQTNKGLSQTEAWELAEYLAPKGSTRDFNLGLIDFGALVCKHYNPRCDDCRLHKKCRNYQCHSSIL